MVRQKQLIFSVLWVVGKSIVRWCMRILLSGFEKFDQHAINPTELLMRELESDRGRPADMKAEVQCVVLPVEFQNAFDRLKEVALRFRPDAVISMGLAARRSTFDFERVALNWWGSGEMAEVDGDRPIVAEGDIAYYSTLPIPELLRETRNAGFSSSVSYTAGTYVCNEIFYRTQRHLLGSGVRSGFIHVPLLSEQHTLDRLVQFAWVCIGVLAKPR